MNEILCRECGDPINKHRFPDGCTQDVGDPEEPCSCPRTPQDIAAHAIAETWKLPENFIRDVLDFVQEEFFETTKEERKDLEKFLRDYMKVTS